MSSNGLSEIEINAIRARARLESEAQTGYLLALYKRGRGMDAEELATGFDHIWRERVLSYEDKTEADRLAFGTGFGTGLCAPARDVAIYYGMAELVHGASEWSNGPVVLQEGEMAAYGAMLDLLDQDAWKRAVRSLIENLAL